MGGLVSLGAGYGGHFHAPQPFNPNPGVGSGSASLKGSLDEEGTAKKKIVPASEVRVYGRGELPLLTQALRTNQNRGASKYRQNSKRQEGR